MTDPTAGALIDPEATPESETVDPAPGVTEDPTVAAPVEETETTPSESTVPSTESPAPSQSDSPTSAPSVPGRVVAAIDPSVEQGNRVTQVSEITRTDPLVDIKAKIVGHYDNASHIIADLQALADELETLLNTLRLGL